MQSKFFFNNSNRNTSSVGTFTIKSGREDIEKDIEPDRIERIKQELKTKGDVFVNSISSENLGETIADNVQGDLYTVVTTYLDKNKPALKKLLKQSRVIYFSAKEFFWLDGRGTFYNCFRSRAQPESFADLKDAMVGFLRQKHLKGSLPKLLITLSR